MRQRADLRKHVVRSGSCPTQPNQQIQDGLGWAVVNYPFIAQKEEQLSIAKGDKVKILEKQGNGWFLGELDGKKGTFPATYVTMENIFGADRAATFQVGKPRQQLFLFTAIALYDYDGKVEEGKVPFRKGDEIQVVKKHSEEGWWEGLANGVYGNFPGTYVSQPREYTPPQKRKSGSINMRSGRPIARALWDFETDESEKLSLKRGELIEVMDKATLNWWRGLADDGKVGYFPAAFVELLAESQLRTVSAWVRPEKSRSSVARQFAHLQPGNYQLTPLTEIPPPPPPMPVTTLSEEIKQKCNLVRKRTRGLSMSLSTSIGVDSIISAMQSKIAAVAESKNDEEEWSTSPRENEPSHYKQPTRTTRYGATSGYGEGSSVMVAATPMALIESSTGWQVENKPQETNAITDAIEKQQQQRRLEQQQKMAELERAVFEAALKQKTKAKVPLRGSGTFQQKESDEESGEQKREARTLEQSECELAKVKELKNQAEEVQIQLRERIKKLKAKCRQLRLLTVEIAAETGVVSEIEDEEVQMAVSEVPPPLPPEEECPPPDTKINVETLLEAVREAEQGVMSLVMELPPGEEVPETDE